MLSVQSRTPDDVTLTSRLTERDHVPWKGVEVIIVKQGDQHKGEAAVVEDVLHNQDTPSGLRVLVRFQHYNPSVPLQKGLFDYDDVVEHV